MARHELAPLALRETVAKLGVELLEPRDERRPPPPGRRACRRPSRAIAAEPVRIEPDVRIGLGLFPVAQALALEEVDRVLVPFDGVLERGHEAAAEVEDEVRLPHPLDVAGRELDVVRLGAGGREVHDVDVVRRDLLGDPGERIEGRDDGAPFVAVVSAATGEREKRDEESGRAEHSGSRLARL